MPSAVADIESLVGPPVPVTGKAVEVGDLQSSHHLQEADEPSTKKAGCSGCSHAIPRLATCSSAKLQPVTTSTFELFKVGIGPSSSHTVGPLLACRSFCRDLAAEGLLGRVARVRVELCGSLALTGIGHCTNKAVVLGLTGVAPSQVDTASVDAFLETVAASGRLTIGCSGEGCGGKGMYQEIDFIEVLDVVLVAEELPLHPNGMICQAFDCQGDLLKETTYYSVGGGFVMTEDEMLGDGKHGVQTDMPLPFTSMSDLVQICHREGLSIADVMRRNEESKRSPQQVATALEEIWSVMERCVDRGLAKDKAGELLPGPLGIERRAPGLHSSAKSEEQTGLLPGLMDEMRWLDCYALAVMEENACMGQVVTAPTNGASGVVPATLTYYMRHLQHRQNVDSRHGPATFLFTAAAIGILTKERACISGAAGGCQAEVGTASAMAAAGLCAVLGGSPEQVEEAAEIAMEHSLGMTCDPVLGLVQVPCIERNAMGAGKALNAVALVLKSPATQRRSMLGYDDVLRVMKATGKDMSARYRETAQGGLAADFEESLKARPEAWKEVQKMMDIERIQVGPRRQARRKVTYDEIAELRRDATRQALDFSKC